MDFEKIKTDFEKRYGSPCENIFFAGLPITFFSENASRISGCLSVGEALAVSPRGDGRITVQLSGTDSVLSFNIKEIERHREKRIARLLTGAEKCGVKAGGGDIFVFKNTNITNLLEPLVLGGLSAFCENVPQKEKLLPHFDNFGHNLAALSGKRGSVTVTDGQRMYWLPFFEGYKIVVSHIGAEEVLKKPGESACIEEAATALKRGDCEKFCKLLSKETRAILKENKADKISALFDVAERVGDAAGSGIVDGGGIFSVVENGKIDTFIHNVLSEYRKFCGGSPGFYVTDFADSGFFKNTK